MRTNDEISERHSRFRPHRMKMVPVRDDPGISPDASWRSALIAIQRAAIAASTDFATVMQIVTDGARAILPHADGAMIMLREGGRLVCRAGSGTGATAVGRRWPVQPQFDEQVPRMTWIASNVDADRTPPPCAGSAATIVVPLPHGGRIAGLLCVISAIPGAFSDDDLLTLQLLCGPIATGLSSAAEAAAEQARYSAVARFEATFHHAAVGIAHVGIDGRFLLINECFSAIVGHSRDALLSNGFQAITHPDDLQLDLDLLEELVAGQTTHYSIEKRYLRADQTIVWADLTVSLVRDAQGRPEFFVSVIQDVTEMRTARADAVHDPLTGLLNRRGLVGHLSAMIREGRPEQSVIVAYVDLDGFKTVNDRFGHAEGDRCLTELGKQIRAAVRPGDTVARIGGDEFVLIMPVPPFAEAADILDRVRRAVAQETSDFGWGVTASIGAICVPLNWNRTAEEMVATADAAMYRAKEAGKDRVVLVSA